jgi:hypothetical protein
MDPSERFLIRKQLHSQLLAKLLKHGETVLARKIQGCGEPMPLRCTNCGDRKMGHQRCKKRWCPLCSAMIAADRNRRLKVIVQTFQWPLFITLTRVNTEDLTPASMRDLRRSFGKLRKQKFWAENVKGGIAAFEVTNIGHGWHPHLHAVIDCKWLSVKTPAPRRHEPKNIVQAKFRSAAKELEQAWAKLLGQQMAAIKIKRCSAETITREVIKYTVKGSDLIESKGSPGDLIRAIEGTRLLTTFGSAHGQVRRLLGDEEKNELTPKEEKIIQTKSEAACCNRACCIPESIFDAVMCKSSYRVFNASEKSERKKKTWRITPG